MKQFISYTQYWELIEELYNKIQASKLIKDIDFIYTFMRGGAPIAVHLSHFLEKPVYTDERSFDFTTIKSGTVLIVDDIADTGATLDSFNMLFPTATLFYKPRSIVKPTFYVEETDRWVVFPWEKNDEIPNRPE